MVEFLESITLSETPELFILFVVLIFGIIFGAVQFFIKMEDDFHYWDDEDLNRDWSKNDDRWENFKKNKTNL